MCCKINNKSFCRTIHGDTRAVLESIVCSDKAASEFTDKRKRFLFPLSKFLDENIYSILYYFEYVNT